MGTGVVVLVRLPGPPSQATLDRWRREFLEAFDPDDFYADGPLQIIADSDEGPIPVDDGSTWLDAFILKKVNDDGYRRGDGRVVTLMAEWLESRIPEAEIWCGHDASDESIRPLWNDIRPTN